MRLWNTCSCYKKRTWKNKSNKSRHSEKNIQSLFMTDTTKTFLELLTQMTITELELQMSQIKEEIENHPLSDTRWRLKKDLRDIAKERDDLLEAPVSRCLPENAAERKTYPIYSGFLNYFPHAVAAVSHMSYKGNQQHHPDQPLHWDKQKSADELDALMRHVLDEDWEQVAWRAMANLERKLTGCCQYENR